MNDVDALLASRGVSRAALLAFAPDAAADEAIVLCGSMAEGLANPQSDLDLLYVGTQDLRGRFAMTISGVSRLDVAHDAQGREINVERLTPGQLGEFAERLAPALAMLDDPRAGTALVVEHDPWRLKILHRLRIALPLVNADRFAALVAPLRLDRLPAYLAGLSLQWYLNAREDAWGEQQAGRDGSARHMVAHVAAPRLLAALLAAIGETNPDPKWHWLIAERRRADIGPALLDPLLDVMRGHATGASPIAPLTAAAEPIERFIYARHRDVYKAIVGFSQQVRYARPAA